MISSDPLISMLFVGITFIAATVNGAIGFGFSLLTIAAMAFLIDPHTAVISMSLVTPVLTTMQVVRHRRHRDILRRIWILIIAALIGTAVGTQVLVLAPGWLLSIALGLFTLYYFFSSLRRQRPVIRPDSERRLAPGVGLLAGMMNSSLGASGPVLGSYLHAIGLRTTEFAFAISSVFVLMGYIRIGLLAGIGAYTTTTVEIALWLFPPAVTGIITGLILQRWINVRVFERALLLLLLISGINLLIKGFDTLLSL